MADLMDNVDYPCGVGWRGRAAVDEGNRENRSLSMTSLNEWRQAGASSLSGLVLRRLRPELTCVSWPTNTVAGDVARVRGVTTK